MYHLQHIAGIQEGALNFFYDTIMKTIILLEVPFQYGVVNCFLRDIAAGIRECGYTPVMCDVSAAGAAESLMEELPGAEGVFSFNGTGAELSVDGKSLFDHYDIPFLTCLLDAPQYFPGRIFPSARSAVACVDEDHADLLRQCFPQRSVFCLLHGGSLATCDVGERDIAVLFPGSAPDQRAIEKEICSYPRSVQTMIHESKDTFLAGENSCLIECVRASFERHLAEYSFDTSAFIFTVVDKYVRTARRMRCLRELDRAGIPVDIIGAQWEGTRFACHSIHEPRRYEDVLSLMARSRIVLQVNPNFARGAHERVFSAMANGSVVVADANTCVESLFSSGEDIAFFTWDDYAHVPSLVGELLEDESARAQIAARGKEKVCTAHLWQHRAPAIVRMIEQMARAT